MVKQRIPETDHGITGELETADYDLMQRKMRDMGIMETKDIIKSGITSGSALEIGPGPGYLGLEWLKNSKNTTLNWLEISEDMKNVALKNAEEYGLTARITITLSDATERFPFKSETFDAVFTNGSLHEWANPVKVFHEIQRVLKKGARYFISDLKRNVNPLLVFLMKIMTSKKSMKQGLMTSIQAAYLINEIKGLLSKSNLKNYTVKENPFGLIITGIKE